MIARRFQQTITASVYQTVKRTSVPRKKSSITIRRPASPKRPWVIISSMADLASAASAAMITPFPRAKAVRFDHNGKFQSFAVMQRVLAVGKRPCLGGRNFLRAHQLFCENFGGLNACRRFVGPNTRNFSAAKRSTIPAASGSSGPTTVRKQCDFPWRTEQAPSNHRRKLRHFSGSLRSASVSRCAENPPA